jgi:hypothetical protein
MSARARIRPYLLFAFTGWAAGCLTILSLGLIWPAIFPGILRGEHYLTLRPTMFSILGVAALLASPATLIGGLVGGRVPKEGGQGEQILMALLGGLFAALPFGCAGLWVFSGW